MGNDSGARIDEIVARVRAAAKYRHVCVDTVRRLATEEWAKRSANARGGERAIARTVKAVRSRLHQAFGAYEASIDCERAYRALSVAYASGSQGVIRSVCREVLSRHTSTRERLPILDRLYDAVYAHVGVPNSVLDLACGLHPLSLPWMNLAPDARYLACDIDERRIAFLNRYLSLAPVQGRAELRDVLSHPPVERADLALVMKSATCLERQRKGSTLALIDALQVDHVLVTFPVRSLGRREKGMVAHYGAFFDAVIVGRPWDVVRLNLRHELVYIVRKGTPGDRPAGRL